MSDLPVLAAISCRSRTLPALVALVLLAGCAATDSPARRTRIDVERNVGFTIEERARVSAGVRADYRRAVSYFEEGRLDESIEVLEQIVEEAPELSAPRIGLGIALHQKGKLAGAEAHLVKALEISPGHPLVLNELGIVYRKTGRFAEARASYEEALAVYHDYHFARRNLAILCDLYIGDLDCALEQYEVYLATVPDDAEAAMWAKDIRGRIGR